LADQQTQSWNLERMESLWIIIDIAGPAVLIAALIWVFLRNRNARRGEIERADRGARELRAQLEEEEARDGAP
jgi:hypothetical protein